jgi:hypothetical protein
LSVACLLEHIGSDNRHARERSETPAASIPALHAGDAPIRDQELAISAEGI